MPILLALGACALLALVFGPQFYIRYALRTHGVERPDLPGTGGQLARHLLDQAGLTHVEVGETDTGDHYDPETRAVRLLHQHHAGKSIAAVAIAAHEVAHAIQHAREEPGFMRRMAVVRKIGWIDTFGGIILVSSPLLFLLIKAPILIVAQIVIGLLLLLVRVAVHLVTLPIELDASFGKALPVLREQGYLAEADLPAARQVLQAAAWTYVAAALATLLDVARWFRIIRF